MRIHYLLVLGVVLIEYAFAAGATATKAVTFVGHELEPFYYKTSVHGVQGAYFDVMSEVCKIRHWNCKFKISPFRASLDLLKSGKSDAGGPVAFTTQRTSVYYYSLPLFATGYCFYASPRNFDSTMTYQDLADKTVGVYGPSATELSLQRVNEVANQKIKIEQEPEFQVTLRKAANNTYNFAYANCDTARHWIERNRSDLKEVPGLSEKTEYYIAFSRKTMSEQDSKDFNATLASLRENGFLDKISEKYKIKLAPHGK